MCSTVSVYKHIKKKTVKHPVNTGRYWEDNSAITYIVLLQGRDALQIYDAEEALAVYGDILWLNTNGWTDCNGSSIP